MCYLSCWPFDQSKHCTGAVINGVISVPIMAVMMLMGARQDVMGRFVITRRLKWIGWLATLAMGVAVIAMFATIK